MKCFHASLPINIIQNQLIASIDDLNAMIDALVNEEETELSETENGPKEDIGDSKYPLERIYKIYICFSIRWYIWQRDERSESSGTFQAF